MNPTIDRFTDPVLRLRMARAEYEQARISLRIVIWHRRVPGPCASGPNIGHALAKVRAARRTLLDSMLDCEDAISQHASTDRSAMAAHARTICAAAYNRTSRDRTSR